jgi:hypothetical protein
MLTALAAVLVTQVDLDPRDLIARVSQGALNDAGDPCLQRFVMVDIVVGVNQNLHSVLLIAAARILR